MSPREILTQLNELDEHTRIEAKAASEVGKSALETVCAFANEPGLGGGWLQSGNLGPKARNLPSESGNLPGQPESQVPGFVALPGLPVA